jgi:predicted RNA-binding protein YlqC (UPF0109 family)
MKVEASEAGDPEKYAKLVRGIVTKIVDSPEEVEVTAVDRGRTTVVEIGVSPQDMGKVIGKAGRNIDALRSVTRAAGLVDHQRVHVELLETDEEGDDEIEDAPEQN